MTTKRKIRIHLKLDQDKGEMSTLENSIILVNTYDGNEVLYIKGTKEYYAEQIDSVVWLQTLDRFNNMDFVTEMKNLTLEATQECYEYGFPERFEEFNVSDFV